MGHIEVTMVGCTKVKILDVRESEIFVESIKDFVNEIQKVLPNTKFIVLPIDETEHEEGSVKINVIMIEPQHVEQVSNKIKKYIEKHKRSILDLENIAKKIEE